MRHQERQLRTVLFSPDSGVTLSVRRLSVSLSLLSVSVSRSLSRSRSLCLCFSLCLGLGLGLSLSSKRRREGSFVNEAFRLKVDLSFCNRIFEILKNKKNKKSRLYLLPPRQRPGVLCPVSPKFPECCLSRTVPVKRTLLYKQRKKKKMMMKKKKKREKERGGREREREKREREKDREKKKKKRRERERINPAKHKCHVRTRHARQKRQRKRETSSTITIMQRSCPFKDTYLIIYNLNLLPLHLNALHYSPTPRPSPSPSPHPTPCPSTHPLQRPCSMLTSPYLSG